MKKVSLFVAAALLMSTVTFAQNDTKAAPAKQEPAKTEKKTEKKDEKKAEKKGEKKGEKKDDKKVTK